MNPISNYQSGKSGFTIVELLIVIVVIGILAAIVIVAFSGINARAENTKTITAVGQYAKALQNYKVTSAGGTFPITTYACMAPHPSSGAASCGNITDSASTCFGAGTAITNTTFDTALKTVITSLPQLSPQSMNCNGKMYSGGWYSSTDGISTTVYYYLKGNVPCPTIGGLTTPTRQQADDTTVCNASLS